ncbi:MAG: hypothetical protein AAFR61_22635 [Bacteroidota bacterium]
MSYETLSKAELLEILLAQDQELLRNHQANSVSSNRGTGYFPVDPSWLLEIVGDSIFVWETPGNTLVYLKGEIGKELGYKLEDLMVAFNQPHQSPFSVGVREAITLWRKKLFNLIKDGGTESQGIFSIPNTDEQVYSYSCHVRKIAKPLDRSGSYLLCLAKGLTYQEDLVTSLALEKKLNGQHQREIKRMLKLITGREKKMLELKDEIHRLKTAINKLEKDLR